MATIKHISSKNADYGAAEAYLTFEHDEFTMKPTLDEQGRLDPRKDYRVSTLNCGDERSCRCLYALQSPLQEEARRREDDAKPSLHHHALTRRDAAHSA